MSDKGSGGAWAAITEFFRSFGLGGSLVAGGAVIRGSRSTKAPTSRTSTRKAWSCSRGWPSA